MRVAERKVPEEGNTRNDGRGEYFESLPRAERSPNGTIDICVANSCSLALADALTPALAHTVCRKLASVDVWCQRPGNPYEAVILDRKKSRLRRFRELIVRAQAGCVSSCVTPRLSFQSRRTSYGLVRFNAVVVFLRFFAGVSVRCPCEMALASASSRLRNPPRSCWTTATPTVRVGCSIVGMGSSQRLDLAPASAKILK